MKKLFLLFAGLAWFSLLFAQAPASFKYQAIARDHAGTILASRTVTFSISILRGDPAGLIAYGETHSALTNEFGLVNLEIGRGTPFVGSLADVNWASGPYYIRVDMDPNGGTDYQFMGNSQLLSVPYALHAKTVDAAASLWQRNGSGIFYNDGYAGIGTDNPQAPFHVNTNGVFSSLLLTNEASGTTNNDGFVIGHQHQSGGINSYAVIMNRENSPLYIGTNNAFPAQMCITPEGLFGMGTNNPDPLARMTVDGQIKITGGSPGIGKVLTSNAHGVATWETPAGGGGSPGGSDGHVQFNNSGAFGGDEGLFWDNTNKRLGVGTTKPRSLMELATNSYVEFPQLTLTENEIDYSRLTFRNSVLKNTQWTIAALATTPNWDSRLNIYYSDGTTAKDIISITGNGAVEYFKTGAAHILPRAYGAFYTDGAKANGTDNISCVWRADLQLYEISFTDLSYSGTMFTAVATPYSTAPVFATTTEGTYLFSSSTLFVRIFNLQGQQIQCPFSFIIYSPY